MPAIDAVPSAPAVASSVSAVLVVVTKDGLHMRVASKIVQLASPFESAIEVRLNGTIANAKSLIDLLTLAAEHGSRLHVTATGKDADQAIHNLVAGLPPDDLREATCG